MNTGSAKTKKEMEDEVEARRLRDEEASIKAMETIVTALRPFTPEARMRVLRAAHVLLDLRLWRDNE